MRAWLRSRMIAGVLIIHMIVEKMGAAHVGNIEAVLSKVGLSDTEVAGVMGENWFDCFDRSFGPNE